MVAAGLVAKKALELGLRPKPWVKTSLAPGSRVVVGYLERAGLMEPLDQIGFNLVGFGCTTCIGNSGPLPDEVAGAIERDDLKVAAVLSGNRNFEARIHPAVRANYLASPPLVVAYALAGSVNTDLTRRSARRGHRRAGLPARRVAERRGGRGGAGRLVLVRPLHPRVRADLRRRRALAGVAGARGRAVRLGSPLDLRPRGHFFEHDADLSDIVDARVLVLVGDSVTTDHISPAGSFAPDSPAGPTSSSRAWSRATSTPTAPAAATTR